MSICQKKDGSLCTSCCDVVVLSSPFSQQELKKVRRAFNKRANKYEPRGMLRRISKRRAKKKNPYIVAFRERADRQDKNNKPTYYSCIHMKRGKCQIYESRPYMCHGYPLYSQPADDWIRGRYSNIPEYDRECGFYNDQTLIATFPLVDIKKALEDEQRTKPENLTRGVLHA
ncbi:hypothetical protein ValSw41_22 [Vibrio phage ValSw4_1]|nr:hypothetical protein ValSw41_22 [Vibrio phage ValSw4_1]CAH0448218.1 hypothetical protein SM030_00085 [Vibrio phage vB_VpaS_sm030]CAI5930276.1 hypothetical protein SM031_00085 [Vibrio phage vB_VpaS_sm030]CAI6013147.1 hypothetical protein SM032_00085 [Vibrio phage vB_VpaS_sm030]